MLHSCGVSVCFYSNIATVCYNLMEFQWVYILMEEQYVILWCRIGVLNSNGAAVFNIMMKHLYILLENQCVIFLYISVLYSMEQQSVNFLIEQQYVIF